MEAGLATWTGEPCRQPDRARPGRLLTDVTQINGSPPSGAVRAVGSAGDHAACSTGGTVGRRAHLHWRRERVVRRRASMVVAPARNEGGRIVGAIGVIGPTRINYGRIIPVVDYTARVIARLLG